MMIRLAFAASTCIPPDILIMDEWLTAGDVQFLEKAQRRVETFVRTSSILVLASHSLELVEQWCNRGILLHHGRTLAVGPVGEVVAAYRQLVGATPPASTVETTAAEVTEHPDIARIAAAAHAEPGAV
jgi:ABC-2 type transport system ATP-binding protein/lipopolysaccharide transport system ATP-binding protein